MDTRPANERSLTVGMLAVVAAVVCFGISFSIIKWPKVPGSVIAWWRLLISAVLWWAVLVVRRVRRGVALPTWATWKHIVPAALFFGLNISLLFLGVTKTSVAHSEFNASSSEPVHFMQIWIEPAKTGTPASYEQIRFAPEEKRGKLKLLAGPAGGDGAARINQDAQVFVAELAKGDDIAYRLGTKRHAWLQVIRGNITVNGVAPGFILTDMATGGGSPAEAQATIDAMAARAMVRRTGLPEDIANAVAFLVSSESSFITAQTLTVDGGRMDYIAHP